jgi:hypothetical protein
LLLASSGFISDFCDSVFVHPPEYKSLATGSVEQATRRPVVDHEPTAARKNDTDDTDDTNDTKEALASSCTLRMQGSDTASVASEDYPQTQFENVSLIRNLVSFAKSHFPKSNLTLNRDHREISIQPHRILLSFHVHFDL